MIKCNFYFGSRVTNSKNTLIVVDKEDINASNRNGDRSLLGVVDLDGNIIVPIKYPNIRTIYYDERFVIVSELDKNLNVGLYKIGSDKVLPLEYYDIEIKDDYIYATKETADKTRL